jgi:hypothetical protein
MDQRDIDGWRSATRAVWDELRDMRVFRIIAFLVGSVLIWWLRSR